MSKIGAKNPILVKILIIILVSIFSVAIIYFAINILLNSNSLTYDLGEATSYYNDEVLKSYDEYIKFTEKYEIKADLSAANFSQKYYLASFQDYDPCGETKYKTMQNVSIDDTITVNFLVHNKCGWCKRHTVLYLIEIDKYNKYVPQINYNYTYENTLECGEVK